MEPTEGYEVIGYVPAKTLVYNQPGTCYTLVALSEEDPTAGKQFAVCVFLTCPKLTVPCCSPPHILPGILVRYL